MYIYIYMCSAIDPSICACLLIHSCSDIFIYFSGLLRPENVSCLAIQDGRPGFLGHFHRPPSLQVSLGPRPARPAPAAAARSESLQNSHIRRILNSQRKAQREKIRARDTDYSHLTQASAVRCILLCTAVRQHLRLELDLESSQSGHSRTPVTSLRCVPEPCRG